MLKQCKNFSKDATTRINGRIKEDQDNLSDKSSRPVALLHVLSEQDARRARPIHQYLRQPPLDKQT